MGGRKGATSRQAAAVHLSVLLAATGIAGAEAPDRWSAEGESDAYCRYTRAFADGERAVLLAPELVSLTTSAAGGSELTGDEGLLGGDVSLRQSVGLRMRGSRLWQARLVRRLDEAECRRYRARAQLARVFAFGGDVGRAEALAAERRVLERGLAEAEELVERLRTGIEARTATRQELLSAEIELERLRSRLRGVQHGSRELAPIPEGLPERIADLVTRFREADGAVAAIEADMREARAWDVDLRGGYDQVLDQERRVPAFATITLSVSLGSWQQRRAHARGLASRTEWRRREFAGLQRESRELVRMLRVESDHARTRLARLRPLRDDLRQRLVRMEGFEGITARRHRDSLWFEWLSLEADVAHLEARLPRLAGFLAAADGGAPDVAAAPR